jgi:para-aminobenzoate synthetase / 4-amino-4-deoxychorismate lyase
MLDHLLVQPGTLWLDTARGDERSSHGYLFARPHRIIQANAVDEVVNALRQMDEALATGQYVAGYVAYEAGCAFLPVEPPSVSAPLVWLGVYDPPETISAVEADAWLQQLPSEPPVLSGLRFNGAREDYLRKIRAVKHHIHEGDVYQINFTGAIDFAYKGPETALYRMLRERQRVPYGVFLNAGGPFILSFSPELFFRREGDAITAQPMKGTVRRGATPEEDERMAGWLASDAKSRAENLMIVDLLRNDLSKVCRPGSVQVPALYETMPYETLIQMTSTVEGRLNPGVSYTELFQALFPCGSVTGAPKIRAMQLIRELEARPRGVYCGAIGFAAPDGRAVFNVAIRTLVLQDGRGVMGTGSGIVWDSAPEAEYRECLLKAKFLEEGQGERENESENVWGYGRVGVLGKGGKGERGNEGEGEDFSLIETMRWEDGHVALLEKHLDRLRHSAGFFRFPFDEPSLRRAVDDATAGLQPEHAHRVRIMLNREGALNISAQPLGEVSERVYRVTVSEQRIDSDDVFFYHKTTLRGEYETAYAEARQAGFDEVLFLNERGEVTEGSRTNVFIRAGTALYTPPVSAGLLGGVYRRHLLETRPEASERVLYLDDLLRADAAYLCNAVWGMVEAEIVHDRDSP